MELPKKTRIKSFRIEESLLRNLDRATKRAHITESAFVTELLQDRLIMDRLVPAFPEIKLSRPTFQSILGATNSDALEAAASDVALRNLQLVSELYGTSDTGVSFQEYVSDVLASHAHWFSIEDDSGWTHGEVTLRQEYGMKWSDFVKTYLSVAFSVLSKGVINVESGEQFVHVSFKRTQGDLTG